MQRLLQLLHAFLQFKPHEREPTRRKSAVNFKTFLGSFRTCSAVGSASDCLDAVKRQRTVPALPAAWLSSALPLNCACAAAQSRIALINSEDVLSMDSQSQAKPSNENLKEKEKLVSGPRWVPDTKMDWPTDCRS
jgi:hypothetical protein